MISTRIIHLHLRAIDSGRLPPWIGPALRGLVARRFKDSVCHFPEPQRSQQWRYCSGCPYMARCAYGQMFEPDLSLASDQLPGQAEPIRPVVIEGLGTAPPVVEPGSPLWLRMTFIGPASAIDLAPFLETTLNALAEKGLGPDQVRFSAGGQSMEPQELTLSSDDLPQSPDQQPGTIDRLRIELTSPLFLRQEGRWLTQPTFGDLFRAALRTVGQSFAAYSTRLPADFAALKHVASQVASGPHTFEPFTQPRFSSRTKQAWDQHGVIGAGEFHLVPLSLLPWLAWAGRWHVGTHRVAGAGGWRIVLE